MYDDYLITKKSPIIHVRVSNLFGEPLFKDSVPVIVTFVSAQRADGTIVDTKKKLTQEADK